MSGPADLGTTFVLHPDGLSSAHYRRMRRAASGPWRCTPTAGHETRRLPALSSPHPRLQALDASLHGGARVAAGSARAVGRGPRPLQPRVSSLPHISFQRSPVSAHTGPLRRVVGSGRGGGRRRPRRYERGPLPAAARGGGRGGFQRPVHVRAASAAGPRGGRGPARSSRDPAKTQPRHSRDAAEMQPRCGRRFAHPSHPPPSGRRPGTPRFATLAASASAPCAA